MIEFTCACGRVLSVVPDLAGWTTKCPGCHKAVAVPQLEEAPPPRPLPWKGIAFGASGVAVIAIVLALLSGGKPAKTEDIDEVARLKLKLESRDQELSTLQEERSKHGDPAKLAERLRAAEAERDRLKKALEVSELTGRGAPREPEKKSTPAPQGPTGPGTPAPDVPKAVPAELKAFASAVERGAPSAVIIRTDRGVGAGFFVGADGMIATTYQVVSQSTSCKVSYIEIKGDERSRAELNGQVVAVDPKNNLALVQIVVRRLLSPPILEVLDKLMVGEELLFVGPPAEGSGAVDGALSKVKVIAPELEVSGTKCLQVEAPVPFESSGSPIFNRSGKVVGMAMAVSGVAETAGCAIWATYVQQLLDNRETTYSVRGNFAKWEKDKGLILTRDLSRGIKVEGHLTQFIVDEDRDRVVGLDPRNKVLVVASLSRRKVIRTIPLGAGAAEFQLTMNPDVAWVCHPEARTFLKMDLLEGKTYDRIDVALAFDRFVATRNHLWTYSQRSLLITLKDKKAVPNPLKFGALAHDRRRDRMTGIVTNWEEQKFLEFDPDKAGPILRDFADIDAAGPTGSRWKEKDGLKDDILKMVKSWPLPPEYGAWTAVAKTFTLITDGGPRVYLNQAVMKQEKLDTILGFVRPEAYSKWDQPETLEAMRHCGRADQILAGSPDGKWIATATHIYEGERFTVHKELPIPSAAMAFTKDSRTLYIWDITNRMILPVDVASKDK
jgi:S1-C subfamily serine protease